MTKTDQLIPAGATLATPALTFAQIGHPAGAAPAGEGVPAAPAGGGPAGGPAPVSPIGSFLPIAMIGLLVFFVVSTFMASRRQKRERDTLLGGLKKHDRVQTSGGMIGSIVEIKDTEIVLKVDPTTNTRITFSKAAVQQVLQSSGATEIPDVEAKAKGQPPMVPMG